MPEMDGLEVCQRLKSNPKYRNIHIIMVTDLNRKKDLFIEQYKLLETKAQVESEKIEKLRSALKNTYKKKVYDKFELAKYISILSEEMSQAYANDFKTFLQEYNGDPTIHFVKIRKLFEAVELISKRKEIQLKLIRNMIHEQVETI
jgi:CheY-like chemotaxis protein